MCPQPHSKKKIKQERFKSRSANSNTPIPLHSPLAAYLAHELVVILCKWRTPVNEGKRASQEPAFPQRDLEVMGSPLNAGKKLEEDGIMR